MRRHLGCLLRECDQTTHEMPLRRARSRYCYHMFVTADHPTFRNQPKADDKVWRYMDLARYLSLLGGKTLHFARADQMADTWEGAYSQNNYDLRPAFYENHESMGGVMRSYRMQWRQLVHMNCWHDAPHESAAMWDIYQRDGRGVAVQSTWGKLTSSIKGNRHIFGARVKYVDYSSYYISENIPYEPFMHKRESFAHEREIRLMTMSSHDPWTVVEEPVLIDFAAGPPGLTVPVDLDGLVENIYVAPNAPNWLGEVVRQVTEQYGFEFNVLQSDLGADPID